MKNHIDEYKAKLEKSIGEYMEMPCSERSASAVKGMMECWTAINELQGKAAGAYRADGSPSGLSQEEIAAWNMHMMNEDGTVGGHWSLAQTTAVASSVGVEFSHISNYCWNVTMNMMYSDYYKVADRFGVNTPEFYAEMAKAFLFDKDGPEPKEKLCYYYHYIVK